LVSEGWYVIRFTWEDVMFEPEWVRQVLINLVRCVDARTQVPALVQRAA
jgi:hypothetical protein